MPKSRVRKKKVYTPPSDVAPRASVAEKPSPRWLPAVAIAFAVFGMAWLVAFYMTQGSYPIASLNYWNIAVGFGGIVISLLIFTRWK